MALNEQTNMMVTKTATLLLNQNAIKWARLNEQVFNDQLSKYIEIAYGDGTEPIIIHEDDELYNLHYNQFRDIITANTKPQNTPLKPEIVPDDNTDGENNGTSREEN